jgi:homoserine O-acetyltransferase
MLSNVKYRLICILFSLAIIFFSFGSAGAQSSVRYADLGDFKLENGSVIHNCRVAYLTDGALNAEKSNVVLVPTWLAGTAQELANLGFIGPGKVFDSSQYYIIAVDAFGNGVSSSPSNSPTQPSQPFPQFSIRDMVRAQYMLLTRHLNIRHIRAVTGISMGALQTFQWMVSYPDFMDQAIPILGSPWITSQDMLFWSVQLGILENVRECKGNAAAMKILAPLHIMQAWTRDYRTNKTSPADFPVFLTKQQENFSRYDARNWASQVKAILTHDILHGFGGSREKAAKAVRTKLLVITSPQDQIISNNDAIAFARLMGAESSELDGTCGHFAFFCDQDNLKKMVNTFLSQNPGSSTKQTGAGNN